jgi:hypothetical protein
MSSLSINLSSIPYPTRQPPASTRHNKPPLKSLVRPNMLNDLSQDSLSYRGKRRIESKIFKSSLNINFSSDIVFEIPERQKRYNSKFHIEIIRDKSEKQKALVERLLKQRSHSMIMNSEEIMNNSLCTPRGPINLSLDKKKTLPFIRLPYIKRTSAIQ